MTDRQALAVEYARAVCDPPASIYDPRYRAVTEGRHAAAIKGGWFYSSCGDLGHFVLFRLGVRLPWVNREELDGWSYLGADNNVTTLVAREKYGSNGLAYVPQPGSEFSPGDILVVNTATPPTTHVMMCLEHDPEREILEVAEYGQPGGAVHRKGVRVEGSRLRTFSLETGKPGRWIDSCLPLRRVLDDASARGLLEAPEPVDAWRGRVLGPPAAPGVRTLRKGMTGEDVRALQGLVGAGPDGRFGPLTEAAVKAWQGARGLVADGIAGPLTRAAAGISSWT